VSDVELKITEAIDTLIEKCERISTALRPEWDARRDTAKTVISLSGATLVFTITFSQSVIKPETPLYWRYAVVACWLAFILSLACSLASLWFSMALPGLPIALRAKITEFRVALEESQRAGHPEPFAEAFMKPFKKLAHQEIIALWCLRIGIISYGSALAIFTAIGLRQLLY
jgi:hypothetical protein